MRVCVCERVSKKESKRQRGKEGVRRECECVMHVLSVRENGVCCYAFLHISTSHQPLSRREQKRAENTVLQQSRAENTVLQQSRAENVSAEQRTAE